MLSSQMCLVDVPQTRGVTFHNYLLDSSHSLVTGHLLTFPSLLGEAKTPSCKRVQREGTWVVQCNEDTELPLAPLVPPGT